MSAPAPALAPDAPDAGFAPARAYRDRLFRAWVDAKRIAADSEDPADHAGSVAAYTAFMRAHLARDERDQLVLEDEVARLTAENLRLRGAILTAASAVALPEAAE